MRLIARAVAAMAICALMADGASADPWTETGDAGASIGTAQETYGSGGLDSITGSLSFGDVDIFKIYIPDPTSFAATTVGVGTTFDSQLFLFDGNGMGVYANDDDASTAGLQSTLPQGAPTTSGVHLLAISAYDVDPESAGGDIFPSFPFTGVHGATGPGGGSPLILWSGPATGHGSYEIKLSGARFANPEPGTFVLLGAAMGGLVVLHRRRKRARTASAA